MILYKCHLWRSLEAGQSQDVLSASTVTSRLPPQFSFNLVPAEDGVFLNFGMQSLACCGYPHATSQRTHSKRFGTCWKHRSVMSGIQKAALHLDAVHIPSMAGTQLMCTCRFCKVVLKELVGIQIIGKQEWPNDWIYEWTSAVQLLARASSTSKKLRNEQHNLTASHKNDQSTLAVLLSI